MKSISRNHFLGLKLFGVTIYEKSTVYLSDNVGTDIPQDLFVNIIKNFWNGSCFYVEIKYKSTERNANVELITPEVFYDVTIPLSSIEIK